MDITEITHISLCSGYGGIDLGLRRVISNLRTVAYSEIEAFACELLLARMEGGQIDAAPIWSNLKSFPWAEFSGKVDILSGGYPCQPFSAAGRRLGTEDPRHLWPYIASGIRLLRPKLCFFENVEGHISLGLREVIAELEELGYETTWGIFSAAECGAPHQRKRVFILAHRNGIRLPKLTTIRAARESLCSTSHCNKLADSNQRGLERSIQQRITPEKEQDEFITRCGTTLADTNGSGSGQNRESIQSRPVSFEQSPFAEGGSDTGEVREWQASWPARPGQPQQHAWEPPRVVGNAKVLNGTGQTGGQWEAQVGRTSSTQHNGQTEPTLGGDSHGTSSGLDYAELHSTCDNRTDELRLLGNGVVPATAEKAFRTLWQELNTENADAFKPTE